MRVKVRVKILEKYPVNEKREGKRPATKISILVAILVTSKGKDHKMNCLTCGRTREARCK